MGDGFTKVVDDIRAAFPALSPQLRVAAKHVLTRPDDVAVSSMRALAAQAGVQPVTFLRLVRTLGFESWDKFKAPFVSRMRAGTVSYAKRAAAFAQSPGQNGGIEQFYDDMYRAQVMAIDTTHSASAARDIAKAAEILSDAETVYVAGFRACFGAAVSLAYGYRLFRPKVRLISSLGGMMDAELRAVGPRDAICLVGFKPYSRSAMIVADHASRTGASLVALADSPVAPFALGAQVVLQFSTESASFFPSTVAAWALAEQLLGALVARGGTAVIDQLREAEEQVRALDVFVPDAEATL